MSKIKIKFDSKKIEKEIKKEIEKNAFEELVEQARSEGKMFVLQQLEEEVLYIMLEKYDGNNGLSVSGNYEDFPTNMKFSIGNSMDKLKSAGYLSTVIRSLSGWSVILSPDGLEYFQRKGMRKELFEELPDNTKELLKNIIECEERKEEIDVLLNAKLVENDRVIRGIIGTLKRNGLITASWADNKIYYAELTNEGRTYFEREKKYMDRIEKSNTPIVNIEHFTNSGIFNTGNIENANITIDNSIEQIEKEVEQKANDEDKEELKQLLEEIKDYIDNIKETKKITKNTGLFKRLGRHFEKHQWFYGKVVELLGDVTILLMGNQLQ